MCPTYSYEFCSNYLYKVKCVLLVHMIIAVTLYKVKCPTCSYHLGSNYLYKLKCPTCSYDFYSNYLYKVKCVLLVHMMFAVTVFLNTLIYPEIILKCDMAVYRNMSRFLT